MKWVARAGLLQPRILGSCNYIVLVVSAASIVG
jgi:hypothetical protein